MAISFREPAVNYYVEDVERAVQFYRDHFGFVETFRTPKQGKADHVELRLGTLTLGFAANEAGRNDHGLPLGVGGFPRAELVLWTDDVDEAYAALLAKGVPSLSAPHNFLATLRAAWLVDPDGNPIAIVSHVAVPAEA